MNLDFVRNDRIQEVKAKGDNCLALTKGGRIYYWPLHTKSGNHIYKPIELSLPPSVQVLTASCGYNFVAVITKTGLLFTLGSDNKAGQLGHGDTFPRETLTLVDSLYLKGEAIVGLSCGYKHVICKSKTNKVYTWGWGEQGQLGHGQPCENIFRPKLLALDINTFTPKSLQVQAGFKHCILVLERRIFWWGTNASLQCQSEAVEVNIQQKVYVKSINF